MLRLLKLEENASVKQTSKKRPVYSRLKVLARHNEVGMSRHDRQVHLAEALRL
ncbi:hypothetical protein AAVH_39002 [Aphelenchoides avenae]|nr:hypothetical protein AAVH_39002 [Aphelenchus avenae]